MWPSLKDIGNGIESAASSVWEWGSRNKDTIATVTAVGIAAAVIAGCAIVAPISGVVIAGAAVGGAIGGISEVISQVAEEGKVTSVKKIIVSTALGAASGAMTGGTVSTATSIVGNMTLSMGGSLAKDVISISDGADISGEQMAMNAATNGIIGAISGKIGGAGTQYNKFKSTTVNSILFNGEEILGASTKTVWREYGKYYTDSITKAMVKGFGYGSIPSTVMTTWQVMHSGEEKETCIH